MHDFGVCGSSGECFAKTFGIDGSRTNAILLIHESPLTDALFLLVSKSDEVTTT